MSTFLKKWSPFSLGYTKLKEREREKFASETELSIIFMYSTLSPSQQQSSSCTVVKEVRRVCAETGNYRFLSESHLKNMSGTGRFLTKTAAEKIDYKGSLGTAKYQHCGDCRWQMELVLTIAFIWEWFSVVKKKFLIFTPIPMIGQNVSGFLDLLVLIFNLSL